MWSTSAHTSPERLRSMRTKDGMLARRASRLLCPICLCGMCSPVSSLYSDCRCDNDTPPLLDCRMPRSIFFATSASAIWRKKHKNKPKTQLFKHFTSEIFYSDNDANPYKCPHRLGLRCRSMKDWLGKFSWSVDQISRNKQCIQINLNLCCRLKLQLNSKPISVEYLLFLLGIKNIHDQSKKMYIKTCFWKIQ